jgi:hypothetical protein
MFMKARLIYHTHTGRAPTARGGEGRRGAARGGVVEEEDEAAAAAGRGAEGGRVGEKEIDFIA